MVASEWVSERERGKEKGKFFDSLKRECGNEHFFQRINEIICSRFLMLAKYLLHIKLFYITSIRILWIQGKSCVLEKKLKEKQPTIGEKFLFILSSLSSGRTERKHTINVFILSFINPVRMQRHTVRYDMTTMCKTELKKGTLKWINFRHCKPVIKLSIWNVLIVAFYTLWLFVWRMCFVVFLRCTFFDGCDVG